MSALEKYDHGPLDTYEIVWRSGRIEHIQAHQVTMPERAMFSIFDRGQGPREQRWTFHGEVDGRWKLLLTAQDEDVISVRNVTHTSDLPGATP